MNRKQALQIVNNIDNPVAISLQLAGIVNDGEKTKKGTWSYFANKLNDWIIGGMNPDETPFTVVMKKGNKKLPFYAFSSLALADCPGKGDCEKFCYSLKAWRYPAAFFRQVQNSLLIRFNPEKIRSEILAIPEELTVRLFVDGDFNSVETLAFFMGVCKERPDLNFYGYSKSWLEFVSLDDGGKFDWPKNYLTNASSGSRHHRTGIENAFLAIPCVRGGFDAEKVNSIHIKSKAYQDKGNDGSRAYRKELVSKLKLKSNKVFACPGNCGNCLPRGGHACGSVLFADVLIGIGVH